MDRRRSADEGATTPPTDDADAPVDATGDTDRPIGFWLKLVDGLIERRFDEVLDEHGVTRRQWQLLDLLERGPATREALDDRLGPFVDTAAGESSADHLAELVESGWVVRAPDDAGGDRYSLTDLGGLAHRRLVDVVENGRQQVVEGTEPGAYDTTVGFLRTVASNLGWRP